MKKLMMIAAFMVAAVTANAQREIGTITIQPKGGLGLSNVTNVPDNRLTVAGTLGGEIEYQLLDIVSLAGGLNFSLQGYDQKDTSTEKDRRHDLGYLNIPIVANVYFSKGFAVKVGLQPGFMVYTSRAWKDNQYVRHENDSKDGLKTFDLSIPIGISYEFNNVVFDARYNLGLTKVTDNDGKSCRNSVFLVTCGYRFTL